MKAKLNRRPKSEGSAPVSMAPPVAGLPDPTKASPAIPDPLRLAIANYHYGMALFELASEEDWDKAGGEEAVIDATYGAPLNALEEWCGPATTKKGAVEAMGVILHEAKFHASSSLIKPMADAVLKFLENGKA